MASIRKTSAGIRESWWRRWRMVVLGVLLVGLGVRGLLDGATAWDWIYLALAIAILVSAVLAVRRRP